MCKGWLGWLAVLGRAFLFDHVGRESPLSDSTSRSIRGRAGNRRGGFQPCPRHQDCSRAGGATTESRSDRPKINICGCFQAHLPRCSGSMPSRVPYLAFASERLSSLQPAALLRGARIAKGWRRAALRLSLHSDPLMFERYLAVRRRAGRGMVYEQFKLLGDGMSTAPAGEYLLPLAIGTLVGVVGGAITGITIRDLIVVLHVHAGSRAAGVAALIGVYVGGEGGGLILVLSDPGQTPAVAAHFDGLTDGVRGKRAGALGCIRRRSSAACRRGFSRRNTEAAGADGAHVRRGSIFPVRACVSMVPGLAEARSQGPAVGAMASCHGSGHRSVRGRNGGRSASLLEGGIPSCRC